MEYKKKFPSFKNSEYNVIFNTPDECPMCHHFIEPTIIAGYIESGDSFSVALLCNACHKMFIARYSIEKKTDHLNEFFKASFVKSEPVMPSSKGFSQGIASVSPRFIAIWNQAHQAEEYGLDEICGIGYRKAIEFLVKDYCIYKDPESKDQISKEHLSASIGRLDNQRLISLGHAIRILGNNETHYISKESEGLDDMKSYISSLVSFIQFDLEAEHAENLYLKHPASY